MKKINSNVKKGLLIVIVGALMGGAYFLFKPIGLKQDVITIELGHQMKLKPKDILNTTDQDVLQSAKINVDAKERKPGFPLLGEYPATIEFEHRNKQKKLEFTVVVEDTLPPTVTIKEKLEILVGTKKVNYEDYITVFDHSAFEYTIDDEKVDLSTIGEYDLVIYAKDEFDHELNETLKVIVEGQNIKNTSREDIDKLIYIANLISLGVTTDNYDSSYNCTYITPEYTKDKVNFAFYRVLSSGTFEHKLEQKGSVEKDGTIQILDAQGKELYSDNIFTSMDQSLLKKIRLFITQPLISIQTKKDFAQFLNSYFTEYGILDETEKEIMGNRVPAKASADYVWTHGEYTEFSNQFETIIADHFFLPLTPIYFYDTYLITNDDKIYKHPFMHAIEVDRNLITKNGKLYHTEVSPDNEIKVDYPSGGFVKQWKLHEEATAYLEWYLSQSNND